MNDTQVQKKTSCFPRLDQHLKVGGAKYTPTSLIRSAMQAVIYHNAGASARPTRSWGHLWRLSALTSICPPLLSTLNVSKQRRLELHGGFIRPAISGMFELPARPHLPGLSVSITGREEVGSPQHQRRSNTCCCAYAASLDASKL